MKLLSWIMSRFNVPAELIGDITEDHAGHRSLFRLARQIAIAIFHAAWRTLKAEPLPLLAALSTGWFLHFGVAVRLALGFHTSFWWSFRPISIAMGWTMGRVCRVQPVAAAVLFKTTFLIYKYMTWPPNVRFHRKDELLSLIAMTVGALLVKPRPSARQCKIEGGKA